MVGLGKGVGVPVKLLHESEGHVVTVRSLDVDARRRRSMRDCAMFSRNARARDARAASIDARAGETRERRARSARGRGSRGGGINPNASNALEGRFREDEESD